MWQWQHEMRVQESGCSKELFLTELLSTAAGSILLLAAIGKWQHPTRFPESVQELGLLPAGLAAVIGYAVLLLEPVLGLSLLIEPRSGIAIVVAAILFLGFSLFGAASKLRSKESTCGCLGASGPPLRMTWIMVGLNLGISSVLSISLSVGALPSVALSERAVILVSGILLGTLYWLVVYALSVTWLVEKSIRVGGD